jgi:hypothetical protein
VYAPFLKWQGILISDLSPFVALSTWRVSASTASGVCHLISYLPIFVPFHSLMFTHVCTHAGKYTHVLEIQMRHTTYECIYLSDLSEFIVTSSCWWNVLQKLLKMPSISENAYVSAIMPVSLDRLEIFKCVSYSCHNWLTPHPINWCFLSNLCSSVGCISRSQQEWNWITKPFSLGSGVQKPL